MTEEEILKLWNEVCPNSEFVYGDEIIEFAREIERRTVEQK